jgi:signal transduction histidine kinase
MRRSWISLVAMSLGLSLLLSAFFVGLIFSFTYRSGQPLKRLAIERTARVIALQGEYSRNLELLGPLPQDGSGVLGRLWVVDPTGAILASSTTIPLPRETLSLLASLDRTDPVPQVFNTGGLFDGTRLFLTPMPGKSSDTLVIQDLRRGPGWTWLKTVSGIFLGLSFFVCLLVWMIVKWIFRQRSREIRSVMQRISSGELSARLKVDKIDEVLEISSDFNQMADQIERLFKRIQEIETSKIELIRNLAHDIRTPLTSLRAASETLNQDSAKKPNDEDRNSLLKTTHEESVYLGRLVENLLFISELSVERTAHQRAQTPVDLRELTRRRIEQRQINPLRADTNIHFECDFSTIFYPIPDLYWSRLLNNLIENAERHARSAISVSLRQLEDSVQLEVLDDGPGLPEYGLKNYGIERPHRHDHSCSGSSDRELGVTAPSRFGLGSVIIRSIVENSGGTLRVSNRPTGGLRVCARFPLKQTTPPG